MPRALLEVSNVETYYGPIMAIRGISFTVPKGQIVTILGANGAGKTTILKTVSGVMDPQKGSVLFDGKAIHGMDPDRVMRLGLSHVPEGREVFPFLSVRENLRMGAYTRSDPGGSPRTSRWCTSTFRCCRRAPTSAPARCPGASSRCSRSAAR